MVDGVSPISESLIQAKVLTTRQALIGTVTDAPSSLSPHPSALNGDDHHTLVVVRCTTLSAVCGGRSEVDHQVDEFMLGVPDMKLLFHLLEAALALACFLGLAAVLERVWKRRKR